MTRKHAWGTALYYLVTLLIAFIAMVPFVWMISTSLKTRGALMSIPIEWVPEILRWMPTRPFLNGSRFSRPSSTACLSR